MNIDSLPRRGEVWDVDFNPTIGTEMSKIRPAVIISSDAIGRLPIKIIVPVTGWKDHFANNLWHVCIRPDSSNGLQKISAADALQARGVDIKRFIRRRGSVSAIVLEEVVTAVAAVIEFQ